MAQTLTLGGFGGRWVRNLLPSAPNFAPSKYYIPAGYGTAIGFGDLVITASGGGGVNRYAPGGSLALGWFAGCLPYFDTVLQQVVNKQFYAGTESPADVIECWVIDDPFAVAVYQVGNSSANNPVTRAMRGGNIDIALGGGANLSNGLSRAFADATTFNATTATLPLRVLGLSQMMFAGWNPANAAINIPANTPVNDYIDVRLNTSEQMTSTGI